MVCTKYNFFQSNSSLYTPTIIDPVQQKIGEIMADVQMGLLEGFKQPLLNSNLLCLNEFNSLKESVKSEIYQTDEEGFMICFPFIYVSAVKS
jgi:hypothetical protein